MLDFSKPSLSGSNQGMLLHTLSGRRALLFLTVAVVAGSRMTFRLAGTSTKPPKTDQIGALYFEAKKLARG